VKIRELTVFLENKLGRFAEVARILKKEDINLLGFSAAEARDDGILRLVVSDPEKARNALKKSGFTTHAADAICVGVEDKPGELLEILNTLTEEKINVDYIYVIAGTRVVLSVADIEKAEKILKEKGFGRCL